MNNKKEAYGGRWLHGSFETIVCIRFVVDEECSVIGQVLNELITPS